MFKDTIKMFLALLIGLVFFGSSSIAGDVTQSRLNDSENEPQNWIHHHGNYEAHRFSALTDINKSNVGDLKVAFTSSIEKSTMIWTLKMKKRS